MSNITFAEMPKASPRPAVSCSDPIALRLNPPPPIIDVFDPIIRRAIGNILEHSSPSSIIGHHRWCGTERDREAGAVLCETRLGYRPDVGRIVLTSSTQSSLNMLLPGLVGDGGVLAVDELTYPPIKVFAARYGIKLAPVRLDDEGITPDAFRAVCEQERPKALYPLSTLQNPTTGTMSLQRRHEIVAIARHYNVSIIEDDIYSLIPENAPPPLSALAPEISWYLLGLAKSVAPGTKVAYVVAPSTSEARRLFWPGVRATFWMTAPLSAALATELVEARTLFDLLHAVRAATATRHRLVHQHFRSMDYRLGAGGLHVWIATPPGKTSVGVATELEHKGVLASTSDGFVIGDTPVPDTIRIGLGNPATDNILESALTIISSTCS
ncbi:aminotransferase class I/II-fold pyridoxal phosphate-dependent enzyme [Sinorhizobium medicae]|nr:aminotransferase class I/II-fold pyridoxal phosphate-dependent enzyme [Sinorhizobium medicae]MDX0673421.1 aminotransferase class I/II-fold pyridoxal phosphate-dependent enzyme [Sinorhizobium medicae]MDX0710628.1 aminotransferase class I/II-fold pyridoxal phosphate-dependent enzyme [Sinorhizobium medicae]